MTFLPNLLKMSPIGSAKKINMYHGKSVSLILPTFNEKRSIRKVIQKFEALKVVDEIIVVNNNAALGTSQEVAKTSAKEVLETTQGYGAAIRRGFKESFGDIIVVCEPDATFLPHDIFKFLSYSDDVDAVYGSRTIDAFIWKRANMSGFLRLGNWAVAKLIEVLFNTHYLSDVGCTYRLIKRKAWKKIEKKLKVNTSFFGPEMMLRGLIAEISSVQIPVNYKKRVGRSAVTGNSKIAFFLGIKMVLMILSFRFGLEKFIIPLLDKPIKFNSKKKRPKN